MFYIFRTESATMCDCCTVFIQVKEMDGFGGDIKANFLVFCNPSEFLCFNHSEEMLFTVFKVDMAFPAECFNDIDFDMHICWMTGVSKDNILGPDSEAKFLAIFDSVCTFVIQLN